MLEKLYPFRWQALFLLLGLLFLSAGIFMEKANYSSKPSIEIINDEEINVESEVVVVVEVSGSVNNPGVYSLTKGARVDDAIKASGGLTEDADLEWIEKYLNKAAVVVDGQKIFIPPIGQQSNVLSASDLTGGVGADPQQPASHEVKVNINTASQSELEALWGIGPVTAQNIIEQRIYSSVEELLSKSILKKNVYERNKDILSVY